MTRWLETDSLSNQNISSAAAIGAYTADADRLILCDVSVDAVAGGGDYVMYITRQIAGAGSSYVILPKTTMTAAAGETAISGQSGHITVRTGDVLTVYVDGLAGDTTTPDTAVRWFEMAALRPTTADRTLDIETTGEASANVTYSAGVALTGRLAQVTDLAALGNAGLYSYSATVDDGANPLDGVFVQCATDAGFTNVIGTTYSNASGAYTVRSDQAGTHYLRFQLAGWNFSDETVTLA